MTRIHCPARRPPRRTAPAAKVARSRARRHAATVRLLAILVAAAGTAWPPRAVHAQDQDQPLLLYQADYKIGYADLEQWLSDHQQRAVPVLNELVEEGIIEGYNAWQHSTGGEYNFKLMIRARSWDDFDRFWTEYLTRLRTRAPDAFARTNAQIQAHRDEIWNVSEFHFSDQAPPAGSQTYQYESLFQVGFGDLEEFNRLHEQHIAPVLNQAMQDGLLGGWVRLGHNTGGRYNWKLFYFFPNWDSIEDLFDRLLPALMADAAVWSRFAGMIQAHDDIIWVPASQQ